MNDRSGSGKKPDYGIDAPDVVVRFFLIGATGLLLGFVCSVALKKGVLPWARFIAFPFLSVGFWFFLAGATMLWGSKVGKLRLRDKIISAIPWRGDESVLDVGCGHGLMLIAAARRLTTGKAVGIDLWQKEDQAGNSREATWENVRLENVSDRVQLQDGDARNLPFADNSFDVVLSSWALHNIYDRAGRHKAIREIVRVLRPGGRLVISDIRHTKEYAQVLGAGDMTNIQRSCPNFLFMIPTFTVTALKQGT
jgi:arsenite methyltransferase